MYWHTFGGLTTRWSGHGLSGPRVRIVELRIGYENARSQYRSRFTPSDCIWEQVL